MVKIDEQVSRAVQERGLEESLERVCKRGQPQFANRLSKASVVSEEGSLIGGGGYLIFWVVVEETPKYWLGIIPHIQRRKLLSIALSHWPSKKIKCVISDRLLLTITKEEIQGYAERFQIPEFEITKDFV